MTKRRRLWIGIHYEYPFGGMANRPEWLPKGPDDYRRDLAMIKDTGFNCIRIRIGLDSDLDDVARLLDICRDLDIQVLYGFATFYVNNQFLEAHPDAKSIDMHGIEYPLHAHDYRWQRCCINHPEYRARRNRLVRESVTRFRDHPAVMDWDVHNEPSLGPGDYPCYNPHTLRAFREHCAAAFEDVAALNERFGQSFPSFGAVAPPRVPDAVRDGYWRFWREFMTGNLSDFLLEAVDIVHALAPGARASFNYTYPWSPHRTAQDWWQVRRLDYASTSLYRGSDERTASSAGSSLSLLKSLAQGKETWVTEFQGGPFRQDYLWRGHQLEAEMHQVFSHAIEALYIYRWEPLLAGPEPWINGLVDVDNYDTERRLKVKETIAALRGHEGIVAAGQNVKPRIGIYTSRETIWSCALSEVPLNDITTGQYALFHDLGFEVTFLTDELTGAVDVDLLCVPYVPALTDDELTRLHQYMEAGGRVVAELPMHSLELCQAAGARWGLECAELTEPIYFIAGWSIQDAQGRFGGFTFHDRVRLNGYQGRTFASFQDNDEPALIETGPRGNLLIPTFALGRSYVSSFHHSLRQLIGAWLPDDLEPDIKVDGVPAEYRALMEARIVESDEGTLLFAVNRSGFAWEVTITPRGYAPVKVQLPTHGGVHTLVTKLD